MLPPALALDDPQQPTNGWPRPGGHFAPSRRRYPTLCEPRSPGGSPEGAGAPIPIRPWAIPRSSPPRAWTRSARPDGPPSPARPVTTESRRSLRESRGWALWVCSWPSPSSLVPGDPLRLSSWRCIRVAAGPRRGPRGGLRSRAASETTAGSFGTCGLAVYIQQVVTGADPCRRDLGRVVIARSPPPALRCNLAPIGRCCRHAALGTERKPHKPVGE
jgi:hypothetical protein